MPGGTTTYSKRGRRNYRRRYGRKPLSRGQYKAVKKILENENEIKTIAGSIENGTSYLGNSQIQLLTGIAQGDDINDRDGNEVNLRSIQIRMAVQDVGAANAVGDVLIRLILVMVKETDGANPTIAEILAGDDPHQVRNWDNRKDFKVYWDKTFVLPKRDTVGHRSQRFLKYYKKFKKGIKMTYDDTAVGVASTQNNHFFFITMSDAADTDDPNFDGIFRVTYYDS